MQITKEIINNPKMRSRLTASKYKTIFLVCLISLTSLLVRQTLQVQHSCNPMIHWSGELPPECQVAENNSFESFDDFSSIKTQISKSDFNNFSSSKEQIANRHNVDFDSSNWQTKQEFETPKQPTNTAQNTIESQPDKIIIAPESIEPEIVADTLDSESEDRSNSVGVGQFIDEHSNDIVGAVAGVAGGIGTVAAASATAAFSIPVAGAVAIGMSIWFLIRSAL